MSIENCCQYVHAFLASAVEAHLCASSSSSFLCLPADATASSPAVFREISIRFVSLTTACALPASSPPHMFQLQIALHLFQVVLDTVTPLYNVIHMGWLIRQQG